MILVIGCSDEPDPMMSGSSDMHRGLAAALSIPPGSTLEVEPEVSDVVGSGSTGLPMTNKRSVITKVRVAQGETAVIGGLKVKNEMKITRKIPLLGSIPILGHLFRHTDKKVTESEITVLITPTLWQPSESVEDDS